MKLEKWKTSVVGVGPWLVQDHDDPLGVIIGQFREEGHADIFIAGLSAALFYTKKECAMEILSTSQDYCHHK